MNIILTSYDIFCKRDFSLSKNNVQEIRNAIMKIEELSVEASESYERNPRKNEGTVNVYLQSTMVRLKLGYRCRRVLHLPIYIPLW